MLNLATYKDAQYGLLIPTPALMALLHLENRSYLQRLKSQLSEGIDYIKLPNPNNNNSPVVCYTFMGLQHICELLNTPVAHTLSANAQSLVQPGGALTRTAPTVLDSSESIPSDPFAPVHQWGLQPTSPALPTPTIHPGTNPAAQWLATSVSDRLSHQLNQQQTHADLVQRTQQQTFEQIQATADLVLRIQQESSDRTEQSANRAAERTAQAYESSLKCWIDWLFIRDDPMAIAAFLLVCCISTAAVIGLVSYLTAPPVAPPPNAIGEAIASSIIYISTASSCETPPSSRFQPINGNCRLTSRRSPPAMIPTMNLVTICSAPING